MSHLRQIASLFPKYPFHGKGCTLDIHPMRFWLQTTYVFVLEEETLVSIAYLIGKAAILSGRKAFGVGKVDCFFLCLCFNADLMVGPFGRPFGEMAPTPNCWSLMQQIWTNRKKLQWVIMETLNSSSIKPHFNMSAPQEHQLCGMGMGLLCPTL
jgi:hypothetical protein